MTETVTETRALRTWSAVTALAVAVFAVTATEMMPVAVLPEIGAALGVSVGVAGLTVTVFGVVAGLSAPLMTTRTRGLDRRTLVLAILGAFVVGNAATAVVTNYPLLLAVRLSMGLCHGLMWSIIAGAAVRLVPPTSAGRATAAVFSGISLALVLGIPAGTALSAQWGWRAVFVALAALAAATLIAVAILVPRLPARATGTPRWRTVPGPVYPILAVTALVVVGNYAAYTYVAPFLLDHNGIQPQMLGAYLLVYGVAGVVGNAVIGAVVGGRRSLSALLVTCVAILSGSLVALRLAPAAPAIVVVVIAVWGASYSALPVVLQTLIFAAAPDVRDAATSLYVMVFNVAIAGGAFVGAVAIDAVGPAAPMMWGALFCGSGACVTLGLWRRASRNGRV